VGGIVLRSALAEGTVLAGRYRVERLIGEGGMGDVYLATHLRIDKPVAIKVLAPEQMRRPRTVGRFLQEAKAASKIRHDNVVDITDFGEAEGCAFFVMEYLDGEDLSQLLKRETRVSWPRAKDICVQLLAGLGAAHDAGIIHRDVKPHNCFITPRESRAEFLKVIDFGIAKLNDGSEEQLTRTGAIMGTAEYMSPEQGQGLELDGRSDLYSVGVILYRLLTGQVPYRGGNPMAILYQHIHAPLPPPSEACPEAGISGQLDALVAKALAKDAGQRFATAAEFIAAIEAIDDDAPAASAARAGTSGTVLAFAAGVGVLMLMGAVALAWSLVGTPATPGDAPVVAQRGADAKVEAAAPAPEPEPAAESPTPVAVPVAPEPDAPEPELVADDDAGAGADPADDDAAATDDPKLPARRSARKLDAAFGRVAARVQACGKQAGLFPGEKVTVDAKIATSGKVTSVTVQGAHNAAGKSCIVGAVKKAAFEPAGRSQTASHRFSI
jgi:serine/threonine-protein kinase